MTSAPTSDRPTHNHDDYHFLYNPWRKTILVSDVTVPDNHFAFFFTSPLYAPLLFPNLSSDARDHCANERTFLSWLRLSMYLAIVSAAIFINFHLKLQPTDLENRLSHPLGYIFWFLAMACLGSGFANYVRTVAKYATRSAVVQHGAKTQIVFAIIATTIIAACVIFLAAAGQAKRVQR